MELSAILSNIAGSSRIDIGELNKRATFDRTQVPLNDEQDPLRVPQIIDNEEFEINEGYRVAEHLVAAGEPIIFVSGKAGTGKSMLIRHLRNKLAKNIAVIAPTGVAALNVAGATIHSFCHFPPRVVTDKDIKKLYDRRLYSCLDLLIIDEVSMIRADIMDSIDMFLRKNGRYPNRPFGGVQVLLLGDLFQLPPVVTRQEEALLFARQYTSPYFFSSKALSQCRMIPVELSKIYRQADPAFAAMLNRIRLADDLADVMESINTNCRAGEADVNSITLTCTNAVADAKNALELNKLAGPEHVCEGIIEGKFTIEQDKLPSPMNLKLKLGAKVMFTKNDTDKRWVNGSHGCVVEIEKDSIKVELLSGHGVVYDVQRVVWESYKYQYDEKTDKILPFVVGSYTQFPLMLAWAVTIHKGQGKTLDKVHIDLGDGAFASGQVYVAFSRVRHLKDITLARPIKKEEVRTDQRIVRFYKALDELQQEIVQSVRQGKRLGPQQGKCPYCSGDLVLRKGIHGEFFGCSSFPKCRFSVSVAKVSNAQTPGLIEISRN